MCLCVYAFPRLLCVLTALRVPVLLLCTQDAHSYVLNGLTPNMSFVCSQVKLALSRRLCGLLIGHKGELFFLGLALSLWSLLLQSMGSINGINQSMGVACTLEH